MQLKVLGENLSALNSVQSVLSIGGLTESEQNLQIIASLNGYSLAAKKSAIIQAGLNEAQIRAILASNAYQGELLETTTKELANAAATAAVERTQQSNTASTVGLGFAYTGLTASIKKAIAASIAFIQTNPLAWIGIAAGAIALFVAAYKALNPSLEKQKEHLAETKDSLTEITDSLSQLESEIDSVNSKIHELSKLDNPSFTDQEELNRLREVSKELAIQKDLKEAEELQAAEKLYTENRKTFKNEFETSGSNIEETKARLGNDLGIIQLDLENNASDMIAAIQWLEEQMKVTTDPDSLEIYNDWLEYITGNMIQNGSEFLTSLSTYKQNILDIASVRDLTADEQEFYDYISSIQKGIYTITNPAGWNQMEFDSLFNTDSLKKTKEELLSFAKKGTLTPEMLSGYDELNEMLKDSDFILEDGQDAAELVCRQLNSMVEIGNDAANALPTFSDIFASEDDDGLTTRLELLKKQLNEVESAYKTCLEAKQEYDEQGYLSIGTMEKIMSLGDDYLQYLFDEEGQVNIDADAFRNLALAKINEMEAQALSNLADQISKITDEASATEFLKTKVDGLASSYCDEAAAKLFSLQVLAADSGNGKINEAYSVLSQQYHNVLNLFQKSKNGISTDFNGEYKKSGASSAPASGSGNSDPIKDKFTEKYNLLKHDLEMEYITQKDYYDQLNDLNEQYYAGKEEYLDDYRKYEEEIYKGLKSYYKSYADSQTDMLKKQLEAGMISYQDYTSSVTSLIRKMYSEGKISAQEYYGYEQQLLETQKSMYDKALSAVIKRIDREKGHWQELIDGLEQQNDSLESQKDKYNSILDVVDHVYQKEIDAQKARQQAIDDQIASLQKSNEEEKEAIDLANAKYSLEKARTNRTRLVYDSESRQYIYKTDTEAVKTAGQELKDLELNRKISAMEAEKDAINSTIEELEKYRRLWNDITTTHDTNIKQQLAAQLWGQDYEKLILSNRVEDIAAFSENYLAIQAQIDDNTAMIESYETKVAYYDSLKEKWNEVSGSYEEGYSQQMAAMILGQDWEKTILEDRTGALEKFRQDYTTIQQSLADVAWKSANEQIMAAKEAKKAAEGQTGAAGNISSGQPPVSQGSSPGSSTSTGHSSTHTDTPSTDNGKRYNIVDASGNVILPNLTEAKKDNFMKTGPASWSAVEMNPVAESEKPKQYAVLDKETGKMYKDKFPSFETADDWIKQMKGMARMRIVSYHNGLLGDYPSSTPALQSTVKQIGTRRLSPDEFLAILQKKELVINPTQQKTLLDNISILGNTLLKQQFHPLISPFNPSNTSKEPTIINNITMGGINLHGVQNVEDFGAEIGKRFKNVMYQNLRSMKYR